MSNVIIMFIFKLLIMNVVITKGFHESICGKVVAIMLMLSGWYIK